MIIIDAPCWKCKKDMKVALFGTESGDVVGGPEIFSEEDKELAEKNDVFLKMVQSVTADETYLANACENCGAFVGKFYFFAHYLTPALYGEYKYKFVE